MLQYELNFATDRPQIKIVIDGEDSITVISHLPDKWQSFLFGSPDLFKSPFGEDVLKRIFIFGKSGGFGDSIHYPFIYKDLLVDESGITLLTKKNIKYTHWICSRVIRELQKYSPTVIDWLELILQLSNYCLDEESAFSNICRKVSLTAEGPILNSTFRIQDGVAKASGALTVGSLLQQGSVLFLKKPLSEVPFEAMVSGNEGLFLKDLDLIGETSARINRLQDILQAHYRAINPVNIQAEPLDPTPRPELQLEYENSQMNVNQLLMFA